MNCYHCCTQDDNFRNSVWMPNSWRIFTDSVKSVLLILNIFRFKRKLRRKVLKQTLIENRLEVRYRINSTRWNILLDHSQTVNHKYLIYNFENDRVFIIQ